MHYSHLGSRIAALVLALVVFAGFFTPALYAEEAETEQSADNALPEEPRVYGRNLPMAVAQVLASNLFIYTWNFMGMQSYARVSPTTWKQNLKAGPEWDRSDFFTNQILHSYHGNTYYMGARGYGFSFWESVPFALLGSYLWEFYGETDTASINDLIVTTAGGAAFGEAGYRLAIAFTRTGEGGARGFFRSLAAWVVNPMYMLNRAVFGDCYVERNKLPWTPIELRLRAGIHYAHDDDNRFSGFPNAYLGLTLDYGDPLNDERLYGPYELFNIKVDGEIDFVNPSWDIFADAILCGFKLFPGDARVIMGLYQQFDYLETLQRQKLAANGAGAGTSAYIPFGESSSIAFKAQFYALLLGLVDSRYTRRVYDRTISRGDDSKGPGWSCKTGITYTYGDCFSLSLAWYYYWIEVWDGADRRNSVNIFTSTLEVPLTENLSAGLEGRYYRRWSDVEMNKSWSWNLKAFVSYKL